MNPIALSQEASPFEHYYALLYARHCGLITTVHANTDNPVFIIDVWEYTEDDLLDILEREGCP